MSGADTGQEEGKAMKVFGFEKLSKYNRDMGFSIYGYFVIEISENQK
jgi:hypothetical protein